MEKKFKNLKSSKMQPTSTASSLQGGQKRRPSCDEISSKVSNELKEGLDCHHISSVGEYITIGEQTFKRVDFANIFVRDLRAEMSKMSSWTANLANPVPLGLACFSFNCLTLGLVNARVRGATDLYLLNSSFIFCGAGVFLSGLMSFIFGDIFAMTVFGSFGAFWISWGCLNLEQFGVAKAYADDPQGLDNVLGFYLAGWCVFNFLVMVCSMKGTWGLFLLLLFLDLTFLMLCIGSFTSSANVSMAGGYFGILSSVCGFYSLYCSIANKESSYVPLIAYPMPGAHIV